MEDIEKTFDKYVLNKIDFAMKVGAKWEILSTNSFEEYEWHHFPNENGGYGKPLSRYTRHCKLGNCFIITSWIGYSDGTPFNDKPPQVIAGNYCGEGLNKECLEEVEKLIQQYNDKDTVKTREQRLKEIMYNNL